MKHVLLIGIGLAAGAAIAWQLLKNSSVQSAAPAVTGSCNCDSAFQPNAPMRFTVPFALTPRSGSISLRAGLTPAPTPGGSNPLATWGSDQLEWHDGSGY